MTQTKLSLPPPSTSLKAAPRSASRWTVPLIAGICLPLLIFGVYRIVHPPIDPMTAQAAELQHLNVVTYNEVMNLEGEAEKHHSVSNKDWERLKVLFHDPDPRIGGYALGAMFFLKRTPHHDEVLALVRPLLALDERADSANGERKADAMILLWQYGEPDWRAYAEQGRNSSDKLVAHAAKLLLEQGDRAHH